MICLKCTQIINGDDGYGNDKGHCLAINKLENQQIDPNAEIGLFLVGSRQKHLYPNSQTMLAQAYKIKGDREYIPNNIIIILTT